MRAVVLAGGGARGAWEAGVLKYLDQHWEDDPIRIVSGTSAGALTAAGYSANGGDWVSELWANTKNEDIYVKPWFWPLRLLQVAKGKRKSYYDTYPLRNLIETHISLESLVDSECCLFVHAYLPGLTERYLVTFEKSDPEILEAVYASSALPFAFSPAYVGTHELVDGGIVANVPLRSVVDAGATKVTVIIPDHLPAPKNVSWSEVRDLDIAPWPSSVAARVSHLADAALDAQWTRDLASAEVVNTLVRSLDEPHERYREVEIEVIRPSRPLGGILDFSKGAWRVELGKQDAKKALA